jgi:transposase
MPKRIHLNQPELAQAVVAALDKCQDVRDHQRLLAMRMAASGEFTAAQIAEHLEISRRQFFNWLRALKTGGVVGLLRRAHGGGAPPQVKGQVLEQFREGLRQGRWKRAKEIQRWLTQEHGVRMGETGVRYWLGKLGGVLKVPRKTPRQERRGSSRRVSTHARREVEELERGWWKAGTPVGGG